MKRFREFLYGLHPFLLSSIASVLTVAQIVLTFALKQPQLKALEWAGWICWWAGVIFAVLPIITFRRKGGVAKGESYMKTTTLVDSGIYAIVRHPQGGTAWLLFNLAAMLIAQHWSSVALGLVSMALVYADTFKADQCCIEKFGDAYRDYMERVPRVNFVAGLIQLILRRERRAEGLTAIADFVPNGAEAGVGLALQDGEGRYLFFLAGTRHRCPPGELFYAGIGGHREEGEDWLECAHREAQEEVGTDIEILSAPTTWYVPHDGSVQQLAVVDRPRPLAFYEMTHPAGTPRAGELYRIVIYKARLYGLPKDLPSEELLGVIALTVEQVIRGPERKPTLGELIAEGARIVAGGETVNRQVRLYPIGTAMALAHVLRHAAGGLRTQTRGEK